MESNDKSVVFMKENGIKMNRRVLMVSTVAATIGSFNMDNIRILQKMGYIVDVAADFNDTSVWTKDRLRRFIHQLNEQGIEHIQIDFSRELLKISKHISSFNNIVKLLKERKYSFIHTHTPIASVIVRLAAYKTKTKVIYTAHGFHFYDGAPIKNWLIFYPVEKYLSGYTDVLITINKEDYKRACDKFKAKKTVYIPGVGVDIRKFALCKVEKAVKRRELGLRESDFVIISVGELNANKNHQVIIKAISKIDNKDIRYVIVGRGELYEQLRKLAKTLGIANQVILTGFRTDVNELLGMADCFAFPSKREGLGLAAIEAMATGLPLITSSSGGIKDYSIDGITGYSCGANDVDGFARKIAQLIFEKNSVKDRWEDYSRKNKKLARKYNIDIVHSTTEAVYIDIENC